MRYICIIGLLIFFNEMVYGEDNKFLLVTMLYHEQSLERVAEYITCLQKNSMHPEIAGIYVFFDTVSQYSSSVIHDYLIEHNIPIEYIKGRLLFSDAFEWLSNLFPNRKIILSNADVYFNETLVYLHCISLTAKTLIFLTRWNLTIDNKLILEGLPRVKNEESFDCWIFKTPFYLKNADIKMGILGCDSVLAYRAKQAGYITLNPCLTVQACHLHLSGIRNYGNEGYHPSIGYACVPWTSIDGVNSLNK